MKRLKVKQELKTLGVQALLMRSGECNLNRSITQVVIAGEQKAAYNPLLSLLQPFVLN